MSQRTQIANDETLAEPVILREGDQIGFSIPVSGVISGISSVTLAFYKEGSQTNTEASGAVYWSTTACTVTGVNTVVTGTTQSLKAGNWICSINGTVDGLIMNIITIPIIIKRRSEK